MSQPLLSAFHSVISGTYQEPAMERSWPFGLCAPGPSSTLTVHETFSLGLSKCLEVFCFWKNTHIPQPDSHVKFGPNACSSRGGTNQGLCVIHGMSVIDFSHFVFSECCSHMPGQVGACTLTLGCKFAGTSQVLAEHLVQPGVPSDVKKTGQGATLLWMSGSETRFGFIFIKHFLFDNGR